MPTNTNINTTTQTIMPPGYVAEASTNLIDSVVGNPGDPALGIAPTQGLIDTPYQNYQELGEAGVVDPRLAGFSPDQLEAFDLAQTGVGAYQPYLDTAGTSAENALSGGNALINEGSSYSGDLSQYQNPYQQDVIDTTMFEMGLQQEQQQDKLDSQAAMAGAFGGSRHGVAEATMERGHDQNRASTLNELNQQGYLAAQAAQEAHRNRQLQGGIASGDLGLNAAQVQSGLGALESSLNADDVRLLGITGGIQQDQLQSEYDWSYEQWQDEQNDPYNRVAFANNIIQGAPNASTVMTASTAPEPSNIAEGIGALGQFASTGNQFGWWGGDSAS